MPNKDGSIIVKVHKLQILHFFNKFRILKCFSLALFNNIRSKTDVKVALF